MKKITIILGIVFLQISLFAQIPTDSLVGYWPFNGNAVDESGNGNDGVVNEAILTEDRFGNPNSAYYFDGIDDYINVGNPLNNLMSAFSISAWIKKSINTGGIIIAKKPDGAWIEGRWQLTVYDTIIVQCYPNPQNGSCTGSYKSILDTSWHFITLTISNTAKDIYYDGIHIYQENCNIVQQENADVYIGNREGANTSTSMPFTGVIDDVRIYNKVLTPCEVRSLYFEGESDLCSVYDTTYISVTDTLIIDAVLSGINPPNNVNTIKIYPNPAKTHIYINNGDYNLMNGYSVKIDNSLGQTVYNHIIDQQEFYVDLSGWTGNGTYFVYIIDDSSNIIEVKKIIIQ